MGQKYNVMIMGASYGSLLGTKLAMAGHNVKLACLPSPVPSRPIINPIPVSWISSPTWMWARSLIRTGAPAQQDATTPMLSSSPRQLVRNPVTSSTSSLTGSS